MRIYEDEKYLAEEKDIKGFFEDSAYDELDCGQGFYSEEGEAFAKIGEEFYLVKFKAEIGSAKQDQGDRLYWVEGIEDVTYSPINKQEVYDILNAEIFSKIEGCKITISTLTEQLHK